MLHLPVFCRFVQGGRPALGFTLSELLIAIAVLGLIATFTIPKVLQGVEASQKKAVFKETIASLTQAAYISGMNNDAEQRACGVTPYLHGTSINNSGFVGYDATLSGIHTSATTLLNVRCHVIFHNGAYFVGHINEWALIDWNGAKPPNVLGDDMLAINLYNARQNSNASCGKPIEAGLLEPACNWASTTAPALYADIFK